MTQEPAPSSQAGASGERPASQRIARSERKRRNYYVAAGLLLLVLLAGVAIGLSVGIIYFSKKGHPPPPKPAAIGKAIFTRAQEVLKPSAQEQTELEQIVSRHMDAIDKIRKTSWEAILDEFSDMNEEIGKVVGPERSRKWDDDRRTRFGDKRFYHDAERRKEERHRMRQHGEGMENMGGGHREREH